MSGERRGYPGDYYAKEWDPVFLTDRNFKEDESYVEKKRRIDAEGNDISIFLRDSEDSVPSCKVHEVEEFCQDARLDHLKFGVGTAGQRRAAWLDDRRFSLLMSGGCVREYQNPLTATGLYRLLKEPRFQNGDLADANRRLIYIPNLDPNFILALAETASFHQVSALRDAIWKHLAFQTSIRVKIPPKGYPIFQMELHIPYFALREYPSPTKDRRQEVAAGKRPPRQWTDLSFLNIQTPKFQDKRKYGTCKARFSLIICGSDHRRWVGYAFVDRDFDSEELEEDDFSYEGIQEDPIASNGELDANLPIWDPREYFLMIFDIQMAKVLKEWENLVRAVERCINEHETRHSSTVSLDSETMADYCSENVKEAFNWTLRTMRLLSQLLDVLSKTIKAWEGFHSSSGGIGYFSNIDSSPESDISERRIRLSLRAINETFETLECLQQQLVSLKQSCNNSAQALQLRLTLESNEAAKRNGITAEITASVISPVALATAYFAMPQAVIPFKLNFKSFLIGIFAIIVAVRLLFVVLRGLLHRSWWWKGITACIMTTQLDGTRAYRLYSTRNCGSALLALRRGRSYPDKSTEGGEMDTFKV